MALAHSVTDNADGTGVVVTISGSSAGTVTVQKATVSNTALGSYSTAGSRTGDGNVTVTLAGTQYLYWRVYEGATTTTATYQPSTAEGDSIYERCLTMLQTRIVDLDLPGIQSQVYVRQMSSPVNVMFPCVMLGIGGESEATEGGPLLQDDWAYPVSIQIIERVPADSDQNRARHLKWRERIHRTIDQQRFDLRVPEVWKVEIVPGPSISIPETEEQIEYRVGMMTAMCYARQERG